METTIQIPREFKRLFDKDWREAAVYGGRYCFTGDMIVSMADGSFKQIKDIKEEEEVLTVAGGCDKITNVSMFRANYDPKPMLKLNINGFITNTTYDHKYFNGNKYVPVYQLVWGIMASSQRRELELLCKQYGENTDNELQRWIQNRGDEARSKSFRIPNNSGKREGKINSQNNSEDIHSKSRKKRNSQSQEWNKNRQPSRELGMGDKEGAITSSLEDGTTQGGCFYGSEFQEIDRGTSERISTISLRTPNNADKNDGGISSEEKWNEIRWDKRFTEWKNLDISSRGISAQENDGLGSEEKWVEVVGVCESVDVWSISTEKYHNYFANGVNVSNSLKSHTVARYLLISARMKKSRVACFREFQNSIAESSHQLLSDLINKYDLKDFEITNNSIINRETGSDFIFKGLYHNEQSIKSVEGIDIAWVEEAQTVSRESLEVLTPTVRKPGSQIVYTYNRLLENDPVHQRLVLEGRPNTLIINVNYDIAEKYGWLPKEVKAEIEDDKEKRPALYKHKWLGEPNTLERKIYKDWKLIDEIPYEARLIRYGIDFGYSVDPTVIVAIYEYNGGFIIDEEVYQKGLSNKSIADILNAKPKALVIADSAEPKSIDEIYSYGVNIIGAEKGQGSVYQGIQYVQSQKISLTKRSQKTYLAYLNYVFREDKDGKTTNDPDDTVHEWSNSMDSIRYGLNGHATVGRDPSIAYKTRY